MSHDEIPFDERWLDYPGARAEEPELEPGEYPIERLREMIEVHSATHHRDVVPRDPKPVADLARLAGTTRTVVYYDVDDGGVRRHETEAIIAAPVLGPTDRNEEP